MWEDAEYYDPFNRPPSVARPLAVFICVVICVLALVWGLPGCGGHGGGTAKAADQWPPKGVSHDGNVFYINPKLDRIISYQDLCDHYYADMDYDSGEPQVTVQSIQYPNPPSQPDIVMTCHYEGI